jgi:hypothetical protein
MAAAYYKVGAGLTTTLGVAQEGQIIRAEDMAPGGVEFVALSTDDQLKRFGRIVYQEYTPQEGDAIEGEIDLTPVATPAPSTPAETPHATPPRSRASS